MESMVAGTAATTTSTVLTTPFDVIKTRIQAEAVRGSDHGRIHGRGPPVGAASGQSCCWAAGPRAGQPRGATTTPFRRVPRSGWLGWLASGKVGRLMHAAAPGTVMETTLRIFKTEGWRGFGRGMTWSVIGSAPASCMYLYVYENLRVALREHFFPHEDVTSHAAIVNGIAACIGRLIPTVVLTPVEMLRTLKQAGGGGGTHGAARVEQTSPSISALHDALRSVLRHGRASEGAGTVVGGVKVPQTRTAALRFMVRGVVPTIVRDVPFSMIFWTLFETQRRIILDVLFKAPVLVNMSRVDKSDTRTSGNNGQLGPSRALGHTANVLSGLLSGVVAAVLTTPADVIKTAAQVHVCGVPHGNAVECEPCGRGVDGRRSLSVICIARDLVRRHGWSVLLSGWGARALKVVPAAAIFVVTFETLKDAMV